MVSDDANPHELGQGIHFAKGFEVVTCQAHRFPGNDAHGEEGHSRELAKGVKAFIHREGSHFKKHVRHEEGHEAVEEQDDRGQLENI